LKALYADDESAKGRQIRALTWADGGGVEDRGLGDGGSRFHGGEESGVGGQVSGVAAAHSTQHAAPSGLRIQDSGPSPSSESEPDLDLALKEINGYTVADGQPVKSFSDLEDDGSTACGCWIYSGIMPEAGL